MRDRDRLAVCRFGDFEELPLLEAKHPGHDVGRERLDLRIQVADHCVVVAARILNCIFHLAQRVLQLGKLFRSSQLGVVLGHGEQALQCAGQLILRHGSIARRGGLHSLRTELGYVFKRAFFVSGVTLHGFNQVGDEIVAPLELYIDVGPGGVAADAQLHQAVVHPDQQETNYH